MLLVKIILFYTSQVLRFVAHYHCATFITTSNADAVLKESFRSSMTGINKKDESYERKEEREKIRKKDRKIER